MAGKAGAAATELQEISPKVKEQTSQNCATEFCTLLKEHWYDPNKTFPNTFFFPPEVHETPIQILSPAPAAALLYKSPGRGPSAGYKQAQQGHRFVSPWETDGSSPLLSCNPPETSTRSFVSLLVEKTYSFLTIVTRHSPLSTLGLRACNGLCLWTLKSTVQQVPLPEFSFQSQIEQTSFIATIQISVEMGKKNCLSPNTCSHPVNRQIWSKRNPARGLRFNGIQPARLQLPQLTAVTDATSIHKRLEERRASAMPSYCHHVTADIQSWSLPARSPTLQIDSAKATIKTCNNRQYKRHCVDKGLSNPGAQGPISLSCSKHMRLDDYLTNISPCGESILFFSWAFRLYKHSKRWKDGTEGKRY